MQFYHSNTVVSAEQEHNRIPDNFIDTEFRVAMSHVTMVATSGVLNLVILVVNRVAMNFLSVAATVAAIRAVTGFD